MDETIPVMLPYSFSGKELSFIIAFWPIWTLPDLCSGRYPFAITSLSSSIIENKFVPIAIF